jgi:hypothetical protein
MVDGGLHDAIEIHRQNSGRNIGRSNPATVKREWLTMGWFGLHGRSTESKDQVICIMFVLAANGADAKVAAKDGFTHLIAADPGRSPDECNGRRSHRG